MAYNNLSNDSDTMRVKLDVDDICSELEDQNSSICDTNGLAINLSTPIVMLSVGVLGNILALVVLYTSKKDVRKTVVFTLLAGLAWTDLIGQLCTGPVAIVTYANNMSWQGGEASCIYHGFVMVLFGILHPLIVGIMSLERFIALKFSYFYARTITRRKAQFSIVVCWMLTGFFCLCPIMGFGSFELQFPNSWCFLNFHRESTMDVIYAYIFSIFNIAVLVFIFVCNCFVVCTLLKMRRLRKQNNIPSAEPRTRYKHTVLKLEMETEMIWFLGAVTIVFCTLWMPININILIIQITGQKDVRKDLIAVRLASINQILDPWLYIFLRKAMFSKILKNIKLYISEQKTPVRSFSNSEQKTMYGNNASTLYMQSIRHQQNSPTKEDKHQEPPKENIFTAEMCRAKPEMQQQCVECSSKLEERCTEKPEKLPSEFKIENEASHKYTVKMKNNCSVGCETHEEEKQASEKQEIHESSESRAKKEAWTSELELNKQSENVNVAEKTHSETDLFLEPEKQRQQSPVSFNEVFTSGNLVRRTSTESNDNLKNRKLQRLHSLPANIEGGDNKLIEIRVKSVRRS